MSGKVPCSKFRRACKTVVGFLDFCFPPNRQRKREKKMENIRKGVQEDKLPFEIAAVLTRVAPKGAAKEKDLLMYSKCFLPTVW